MTDSAAFVVLMQEGARHHGDSQPEKALLAFEKALALEPLNPDAANACATVLTELGQPRAAFEVLLSIKDTLLADADGAANLAIAAENCGHLDDAQAAYAAALSIDPDHLRTLNNLALLDARSGDTDSAIARMQRCAAIAPDEPLRHANLADMLIAGRRYAQAVQLLQDAAARFPGHDGLAIRQVLASAFSGSIDESQAAIQSLGDTRLGLLKEYIAHANTAPGQVGKMQPKPPNAFDLFCAQAFDAMLHCDWRDHDRVTAVLREMLARCLRTGAVRDWRDAVFYGLTLPLREDEMVQLREVSVNGVAQYKDPAVPPFVATGALRPDGRIHVGLAVQNLRDPRFADALEHQLRIHDRAHFALHVYSPTPQPDPALAARLSGLGVPVVEIAHMSHAEAVGRIRLDTLDLFVDMAFNTPWCRPEIVDYRVAPVQIRQTTWHRHNPRHNCEYNMSDRFVHPDELDLEPYGAIVRLPYTCWMASSDDAADPGVHPRTTLGLTDQALVLCALLSPVMIDRQSFTLWMKMLTALPDAVLWLPHFPKTVRQNLALAALEAGVEPARIVYLPKGTRPQTLARIQQADLFVDTLRFNANQGLVDALRMGVPALSCAGNSMASRLGGSIIQAAGLPDCVLTTPAALLARVVQLGNDRASLTGLRQRLRDRRPDCSLFNQAARVGEWEFAWATMVARHRAGLAPTAFDVPPAATAAMATAEISS
jgi:protein O-GlcNAc transferase